MSVSFVKILSYIIYLIILFPLLSSFGACIAEILVKVVMDISRLVFQLKNYSQIIYYSIKSFCLTLFCFMWIFFDGTEIQTKVFTCDSHVLYLLSQPSSPGFMLYFCNQIKKFQGVKIFFS